MESNRIEGIGHQVKGAVIEGLGKAIGDAKLSRESAGAGVHRRTRHSRKPSNTKAD